MKNKLNTDGYRAKVEWDIVGELDFILKVHGTSKQRWAIICDKCLCMTCFHLTDADLCTDCPACSPCIKGFNYGMISECHYYIDARKVPKR